MGSGTIAAEQYGQTEVAYSGIGVIIATFGPGVHLSGHSVNVPKRRARTIVSFDDRDVQRHLRTLSGGRCLCSDPSMAQGQWGELFGPVAEKIAIEPTVSSSSP